MNIRFLRACQSTDDLPLQSVPEIAVAGRSNCGKSSLINAIAGNSKLARASSTPGRTRQLVYFECEPTQAETKAVLDSQGSHQAHPNQGAHFRLVDLPGYGYAKAPKSEQKAWAHLINWYIDRRCALTALLLLSDIRRQPGQEERDLLKWGSQREILTLVALTKGDKVKKSERFSAAQRYKKQLGLARRPLALSVHEPQSLEDLRRQLLKAATKQ